MDSGKFVKSVCELGVRLFFFFLRKREREGLGICW